jgi:IclR family transcriptional regulator, KDG regulon repressor
MDTSKTLIKALKMMDLFVDHPKLTIAQMSKISGIPKTTMHRIVHSLVEAGFLTACGENGYQLGLKLLHFGSLVKDRLDLRGIAFPFMQNLQMELQEAVNLIVLQDNQAIYIEKIDTPQPVRVYTKIGRTAPLYAGACPRLLLAYIEKEEREQILSNVEWKPYTSHTILNREELEPILEETREKGYSVSYSELTEGSAAVAAPIFNDMGAVVGGLSVAGPENRFREGRLPTLIEATVRTAKEISAALGYKQIYT